VWDLATGALQTNFKNWLPVSFEPSPNFENRIYKLKYSPTGLMVRKTTFTRGFRNTQHVAPLADVCHLQPNR
jgi:hypothetical protein